MAQILLRGVTQNTANCPCGCKKWLSVGKLKVCHKCKKCFVIANNILFEFEREVGYIGTEKKELIVMFDNKLSVLDHFHGKWILTVKNEEDEYDETDSDDDDYYIRDPLYLWMKSCEMN
jgi:MinD superfamily P-loop ATPase